ncbi:mitofilin family membrane protein [Tropicibacter sp. S64]|uniref:COG4223 family protein n=1 Tax=Tropicibacter sp. S64 TaxID=3415122 RepID=UPI003C7A0899
MAKAKSNKPSDQTGENDAKPEEMTDTVTGGAGDETVAASDDSIEAAPAQEASDPVAVEAVTSEAEVLEGESEGATRDLALPEAPADTLVRPETLSDDVSNATGAAEVVDEETTDDMASEKVEPVRETPAAPTTVVQEKIIERKGGFVPTVLGGLVAAALGFGAAQLDLFGGEEQSAFEQEARATIEAQSEQIAKLQAELAEAQKAIGIIDLGPLSTSVAGVEDGLSGLRDGQSKLEESLAQFDSRLTAVEKAPVADAVGPEAIAAYERELDELRGAITAQKQAVEEQKAEIMAMAEKALAANADAEDQATLAASRGAAAEVIALAQEGKPFAAPLTVLTGNGVTVPEVLSAHAEEGVVTLTALATDFPDVARDALAAARKADSGEGGGGFSSFLSAQLGARSTQPREGDDPDAVLSRAEADVKAGDLDAALTELAALPAEAQAVLSDWTARAEARRDVLAAAQTLAQDLNKQ